MLAFSDAGYRKKGYSPRDVPSNGGGHLESDQMAKQNKHQVYLNTTRRLTPYDVKVAGTFAEKPRTPKEAPRLPTKAEQLANNHAMEDLCRGIGDITKWIPVFERDLQQMNDGKVGRPFEYSDALIIWMMATLTAVDGKFDALAGFLQGMLAAVGVKAPSPTRLLERSNMLAAEYAKNPDKALSERYGKSVYMVGFNTNVIERARRCGIDATGLSLSSINRWRKKKWDTEPKDRGWLHLHCLSDVDTGEFIAYAVTDSSVGDAPMLRCLVSTALEAGHRIEKVFADGAYCTDENWIFMCAEKKLQFVTSFKVNTSPTNNGCLARGEAARLWCSLPYDEWVKVSGYGTRWKCECSFSDFKRLFPETITARSELGVLRQVMCRIDFYNMYKDTRAGIMKVTGNGIFVA